MVENLLLGFHLVLDPHVMASLVLGTFVGYIIGAIPGLGPSLGVALLVPFTYGIDPVVAMVGLIGLYMAAEYGGSISAVLLNTPGTAASVATAWDGYPMAKKGDAARALQISIISSGIGAFFSAIFLIMTAVPLSEFALRFGAAEYCALGLLGLSLVTSLGGSSIWRGMISLSLGIFVAIIGFDPVNGIPRFSFSPSFFEGIPLVPMLLGLYAISESLYMLESSNIAKMVVPIGNMWRLRIRQYSSLSPTIFRGTLLGYLIGVIPGAGSSIASLVSYGLAKQLSKSKPDFGEGNPEGVAASESANNAAVSGALAPLLALGIPGSATAAVLIGALMIQGVQPGPLLFLNNPEIPYSIFASLLLGVPIMVILGLVGVRFWVKAVSVPPSSLAVIVIGISLVGAYASTNSIFPVYVTLAFGFLGYILRKVDIPLAPIVLALVLVPMVESNFRRALVISDGSYEIFVHNALSTVMLIVAFLSFLIPMVLQYRRSRRHA